MSAHSVINPIEQIFAARRRLKRIAALRAGMMLIVPALTALLVAAGLDIIGAATWQRLGYALAPAPLAELRIALTVAGILALTGCAAMAWRAWWAANDFMDTAERVDEAVGGHQEIVTLASLADPADSAAQRTQRTPLFPLLWRRAAGYLERFDPKIAFAFEVRSPIVRSLPIAAAILVVLAAVAFALIRRPTPEQIEARRLRAAAEQLASSPSPADKELASKILAAANALDNPALPSPEKLQRLADAMSELQRQQQASSSNATGSSSTGKGKSKSKGSGAGEAQGETNGQGQGNGQGRNQGAGANQGQNGQNSNGPKSNQQMVELQNNLSKAQAQIERSAGAQNNAPKPGEGDKGSALKPGKNPNEKGPSQELDSLAKGNLPRPDAFAKGQLPSGNSKNGKQDKGGSGDTHLGEFPMAENFPRFYKPGEGPPIQIRDARYVVFRLPTEVVSASGGKLVPDNNRPLASVPYANVPLKQERLETTPQERQLVPPRYRDLIR